MSFLHKLMPHGSTTLTGINEASKPKHEALVAIKHDNNMLCEGH